MVSGLRGAIIFALAAIAALPTVESSAQPVQYPFLQKLVQSPQYQANVSRLFATLPADVFVRCPALVSHGSSVTVVKPVSFAADGYPISGVWKQSFPVSGCGNDTTINFYFIARADEKITSLIAAPGDTHADLVLQRDAIRYAMMAVHAQAATCDDPHLQTTRFDGRVTYDIGAASSKEPINVSGWRETWTISACGRFFTVSETFLTDATGTQIFATPATEIAR